MSQDKLARVRKLLAMAEAEGLSEEARENYNAKARELIAQYGIDEALLAASASGDGPAVTDREIVTEAPFARDKAALLDAIAVPLGCRLISRTRQAGYRRVFGTPADLERVELLFTSLLVQQALGLGAVTVPFGEHPAAYRRSWMSGFSTAVYRRLKNAEAEAKAAREAQEKQANQNGPSVALVLANKRTLVQGAVEAVYPKLRKASTRTLSGSGRGAGYAAGQRADLGGTRIGTTRRSAITS